MTEPLWEEERVGAVAIAVFRNPPMNYLTGRGFAELNQLADGWADPAIRAVIVTGGLSGRFITHFSVEEVLEAQAQLGALGPQLNFRAQAFYQRLNDLPKPVLVAMNGDAMGAGFELSLSADIRIGEHGDYRYGLPEVRLGLIPGGSGTQRLARIVGVGRALELVLRARLLTPEEAQELGVVHEVVEDARARAVELAQELAALPPTALAQAKQVIYQAADLPLSVALRMEADAAFRAKLAPETTPTLEAYVALPFAERRAWLEARSRDA